MHFEYDLFHWHSHPDRRLLVVVCAHALKRPPGSTRSGSTEQASSTRVEGAFLLRAG
jgi:hypothetical protein